MGTEVTVLHREEMLTPDWWVITSPGVDALVRRMHRTRAAGRENALMRIDGYQEDEEDEKIKLRSMGGE